MPMIVIAMLATVGCAISFEDREGSTHRIGLLWEKEVPARERSVAYKQLRTLGVGLDTTETTGGLLLGYKEWIVLQLNGDQSVSLDDGVCLSAAD